MNFAKINYLFIIWVAPLLLAFYIYGSRRRQRLLEKFAAPRGLAALIPVNFSLRRWIRAGLILGAVMFIALALAGPQYGFTWEQVEQQGVDLIIALDCSRSMLAEDIQPTRLERAKREIFDLLALVKGDRVGLVAFAGTAFLQCPLTLDTAGFHLFLNALTPDYLPVGGTDLPGAVTTAIGAFDSKSKADKAIILITDGENTGSGDPIQAARKAAEAGIKLFCIGVGGPDGVPLKGKSGGFIKDDSGRIVLSKLDEATLQKMASTGGGTYVRSVAGDMDLDTIYTKEIRGKMTAAKQSGGRRKVQQNRYQWPLFCAVLLLLAERFILLAPKAAPMIIALVVLPLVMPTSVRANDIKEGIKAYDKGEYDKSVDHFTAAQVEDPKRPEILYDLGNAYYKKGDYDAAETHLREALPKADPALKGKIHYNLGNVDFRKGHMQDAIANYKKALEYAPNDQQAKDNIEFVKKVIAQKPPPSQNKKNDDKQKNESSGQKSGDSGEKNQEPSEPEAQKPQESEQQNSSDPKNDAAGDSAKPQSPEKGPKPTSGEMAADNPNAPVPSKQPPEKNGAAARPDDSSKKPPVDQNSAQAERMLNRLKDQPGKALMPNYGRKQVEKDW